MPKYNKKFDLTPDDMDLIETAVRTATANDRIDRREAEDLLGRLHNQKVFYRPKDAVYISG
ncbi:MAG: hypothetical protein AAFY90_12125, partial [Pseudomonadota bacterium]